MTETYDTELAIKAQNKFCLDNEFPHFAFRDGSCWKCKRNIYTKISVEEAGNELITGCPHCSISFCN